MRRAQVLAIVVMLSVAAPVVGDERREEQREAPQEQEARLDVSRLPLDLERIKQQLQTSTIREERQGLNLLYFINIYAQAPSLRIFTEKDQLVTGPVPYGAPTHKEFLDLWTPVEFRSPPMDFSGFLQWLAQRLGGTKTDTSR